MAVEVIEIYFILLSEHTDKDEILLLDSIYTVIELAALCWRGYCNAARGLYCVAFSTISCGIACFSSKLPGKVDRLLRT